MTYAKAYPFTAYMENGEKALFKTAASEFFKALMADMLRFFEDGKPSFDTAETLEIMAIREAALCAVENPGTNVSIAK